MKLPVSLTLRLSLLFAGATACVLLVSGLLFERAVEKQFHKHDMEEMNGKMDMVREVLSNKTSYESIKALNPQLRYAIVAGHPDMTITVVDNHGTLLFSVGQEKMVKLLLDGSGVTKTQPVTLSLDNHTFRIATDSLELGIPSSRPANVAISLDITSDQEFIEDFKMFLWIGIGGCTLVMGVLGWMAVRRGLLPLKHVSTMLADISTHRLDNPILISEIPRELQELISAFNKMLARLNCAFQRLSEFSSDIAHELNMPINNMMVQTQVTLSCEREAMDYRTNLQSNLEELERLSRMVSDMLFLAMADNGLIVPTREVIYLHAEMVKLFDFYDALVGERGVQLHVSGAATIVGNRLMIQRALSNLLSNAIRFTPEGMAVDVTISEDMDNAMITIENPGQEIPAEHLPKIFERFYRADPSRREGDTENVGLGLTITKSIVEIHGGTISAKSEKGRTCFTIMLPQHGLN
ncbi:heavy metal sensor histidine kinase [Sideroxydans sp. CL21]|uniref:heavy metal sensor histidine kinase n=1 Tax=Sideroxydans sp. CL21 TaxID=2600596 RepID=UPI0024BC30C3|nr:heavy metal sensor histidine kinase [Sideroxydans sp. CL21]